MVGIAAVNSLLFAANTAARRLLSPYPDQLSISQIAAAGSMAGAVQAVLASPVEMFKVRLQAQYGTNPKRLRDIVGEMYSKYGWKNGIMRGYWVRRCRSRLASLAVTPLTSKRPVADHVRPRDSRLRR